VAAIVDTTSTRVYEFLSSVLDWLHMCTRGIDVIITAYRLYYTSSGARAMHDFGAEAFIEEVQWYDDDDILYRCIVFSISYFVDALIIKMQIWRSLHYREAIRIGTNTNAAWWRSQDASFLLFQWSCWRPLDFLVKRANASFNLIIALLLLVFFFVGFLCNRLGHVVKLARRCSCSQ
jgi:hypothetical protein